MGMTKALQERIFIQGNLRCPGTRFVCVRYGNVLASRGSVIPLFHEQIRNGGPVTITTPGMTRFLISLDDAVDTVFAAFAHARPGEIFVPRAPSARIVDVAEALIGDRPIDTNVTGIRPGEKIHEVMVSDEEAVRTIERGKWYAILPMLPELRADGGNKSSLLKEYSSEDCVLSPEGARELLKRNRLLLDDANPMAAPSFAEIHQGESLR
jgi:UDP-glucose 4-epimerase